MTIEILNENVTVYLADCSDVLPTLGPVDAVVTDPPYGIDYGRTIRHSESSNGWCKAIEWAKNRPSIEVFDAIRAISTHQIIWGGNYFTDLLPPSSKWLIWDKASTGFSLGDAELAWCSFKGVIRRINYPRQRAKQDGKCHPTQKSIDVMMWCIQQLPKGVDTILDPFMGSGTTGVAAVRLGKKFIGIEREKEYFDAACKRLSKVKALLFLPPEMKMVGSF